jgi:hypothetical protein
VFEHDRPDARTRARTIATVGTIAVTRELERRRVRSRPRSPRGSSPPHRQGASGWRRGARVPGPQKPVRMRSRRVLSRDTPAMPLLHEAVRQRHRRCLRRPIPHRGRQGRQQGDARPNGRVPPIAAVPSVVKEDRDSTPLQTSARTADDAGPRPEAVTWLGSREDCSHDCERRLNLFPHSAVIPPSTNSRAPVT